MQQEDPSAQKSRTGLSRIAYAATYSINGLKLAWQEAAFRQECIALCFLIPTAVWLGKTWLETAFLIAVALGVLVVELLNTAIERTVDRIGPQWHELSKAAKDLGSAAVFLSLLLCAGVWMSALILRLI